MNALPKTFGGGRIFNAPVIGVSQGDDPIFSRYKEIIDPDHLTPSELWLKEGLPEKQNFPSNLKILSIIL